MALLRPAVVGYTLGSIPVNAPPATVITLTPVNTLVNVVKINGIFTIKQIDVSVSVSLSSGDSGIGSVSILPTALKCFSNGDGFIREQDSSSTVITLAPSGALFNITVFVDDPGQSKVRMQ